MIDERKQKVKELLHKLLNQEKKNAKNAEVLINQAYDLVKKNSLIKQLNTELDYDKQLNIQYQNYLSTIKEAKEKVFNELKGVKRELKNFKTDFHDFVQYVEDQENAIKNLKHIKVETIENGEKRVKELLKEIEQKNKIFKEKESKVAFQQTIIDKIVSDKNQKLKDKKIDKEVYERSLLEDLEKYEHLLKDTNLIKKKGLFLEKHHKDSVAFDKGRLYNRRYANQMIEEEDKMV